MNRRTWRSPTGATAGVAGKGSMAGDGSGSAGIGVGVINCG
jgi:hypothetical protein